MVVRKVNLYTNPAVGKTLSDLGDIGKRALAQALNEEGQLMFRDSQAIVPHEDGVLQGSGRLTPASASSSKPTVTIGYGGAASKYALRQHEDMSLRHPNPRSRNSRSNGQAKYLEKPVREHIPALQRRLQAAIERLTR